MSSTVQEPSQAERLEHVAIAGVGADHKANFVDRLSQQAPNGSVETPSNHSDGIEDPKADAGPDKEHPAPPQASQRSKGKIALIMGSLMVRDNKVPNSERGALLTNA